MIVHFTHSAFTIKMLCSIKTQWILHNQNANVSFPNLFLERIPCAWPNREKKMSCIGQKQMQGFHILASWQYFILIQTGHNTTAENCSLFAGTLRCHQYWQDWETRQWQFRTQSNGSIQMQCKWIFLGLYLWISLILIHVHWSLTCMKIQCNKGFSSTEFNFRNYQKVRFIK